MRITKNDILNEINKVDSQLLKFADSKPKLDPNKLTVKELTELLEAFKTVYKLFKKCSVKRR